MNEFDDLQGQNLLRLSQEKAAEAIQRFRELLHSEQELVSLLEKRRPVVDPRRPFIWQKVIGLILADGLVATLLDKPRELSQLPFHHFEFFAHLFRVFCERSPDHARRKLIGALKKGAKNNSDLLALYFELIVGAIYWKEGNRVVPVDLLKSDDRSCNDYDVYRQVGGAPDCSYLEYAVEVKAIDWTTGFGHDPVRLNDELERLRTFISSNRARFPSYHVSVRFFPSDRSWEEIHESMTVILERLRAADSASYRDFTVRLRPWKPEKADGLGGMQAYLKDNGYITAIESTDKSQPGLLTLKCQRKRNLAERVAKVMKESRDKLTCPLPTYQQ